MRSDAEKKTYQKSIKMTQEEGKLIEQKAKESGKSFSRYIVDASVNNENNSLKPEILAKITNIINMADEISQKKNRRGITKLRREEHEIWSLLSL